MIYFDELSVAKEMEETKSFKNGYMRTDLYLYAKYLKYKKVLNDGINYDSVTSDQLKKYDSDVEVELRAFCEMSCRDFNYTTKYQDIDKAIVNSNKYRLKLPHPLPITQNEIDAIMTVPNEKYRRMLFIMLVDAKYYKFFNTTIMEVKPPITADSIFYVRMPRSEIQRQARVRYESESEKTYFLGCINRLGLFDIMENKHGSWFIKFVDISTDKIVDYVTDYKHLNLYYDFFVGCKVGKCKRCGSLFRQGNTKTSEFCPRHRSRAKAETKELICVDCGKTFVAGSKSREKIRCPECQKIYRRKYNAEKQKEYKNKNVQVK